MCKLSIIIATYNSAKTIADALKSVCAQTYQNWECIVVDGASTDNTICIVNDFILKFYVFLKMIMAFMMLLIKVGEWRKESGFII